ncbi:fungal-specific transcription factor domain-containing protein [Scheffersomyces xylosifermentans]|uniref:fungal-specific transcription factor domain-containing protein n=1 Tax=Scheffersomyces xylosifermentans TaxID=1304137 RepID=UPI00315CFD35
MSPDLSNARKQQEKDSKRDYSRGGCRECKRRKIKCDEGKPFCSQCTRLKKHCAYPKIGEKVLRVSKKYLEKNPTPAHEHTKPLTIQLYRGPDFGKRKSKAQKIEMKSSGIESSLSLKKSESIKVKKSSSQEITNSNTTASSSIFNLLNNANSPRIADTETYANSKIEAPTPGGYIDHSSTQMSSTPSSLIVGDMYSHEDLNLLASDLNEIVNDIMFAGNFDPNEFNIDQIPFNGLTQESPNSQTIPFNDVIPKHVALEYINVRTTDERVYLKEFYEEFAMQVLPFGSYDEYSKSYANPLRDVLLKYASKEPFLLAAVLAQGAKSSYRKSFLQKDQEAYGSYLSTCLQLLGPALSRNRDKKVKNDMVSNIETILLTVLLLTSSNATTTTQSWRPHLKGAKDIILKATNSKIRSSKTLILCKVWFADFEILAGTSSSLGGTLKTDEELDAVLNFSDPYEITVLKEFGIVLENGFNIMFGYNIQCAHLFRDLLKILNKKRQDSSDFKADDSDEYLRLISGFYGVLNVKYIDSSQVMVEDVTGNYPNLIDIIRTDKGNISLSWMDTAQQAYALAGLLTIFTHILGHSYQSPFIQNLNSRIVAYISFLEGCNGVPQQQIKYSLSMIQWPMTEAGLNCIDPAERLILTKFFSFSAQLGSGSAEIALSRIEKAWTRHDTGKEVDTDDGENNVDIVAY